MPNLKNNINLKTMIMKTKSITVNTTKLKKLNINLKTIIMKTKSTQITSFMALVLAFNINAFAQTSSWWPEKSQTLSDLNNINFGDNNTGWIFGDSIVGINFKFGLIKKTTDKGLNWTSQNMGSNAIQINSSYAFNTNTVIAVGRFLTSGNGAVIKTNNGGISWTRDTTSTPQLLFDVDFVSPSVGWIVGKNGYMATTANAGLTWSTQTTGTVQNLLSLDFVDANNGWAVGVSSTIIHTINGGTTYTTQPCSPVGDLFAVYAFSSTKAITVGQGGNMLMTNNGGTTWNVITSGTTNDLLDITFVDAMNGWAVGVGGTMVVSTDGGLTWATQVCGTTNDITSISMKNTGLGWYCGLSGIVEFYGTSPVLVNEYIKENNSASISPNPMTEEAVIKLIGNKVDNWDLNITDIMGRKVLEVNNISTSSYTLKKENLLNGVYFYNAHNKEGKIAQGKIIIQ